MHLPIATAIAATAAPLRARRRPAAASGRVIIRDPVAFIHVCAVADIQSK
jgi:hypothetical protein